MSIAQERQFFIDGMTISAKQWGSSGVPAIALHGWLDNAASFDALAQGLPELQLLALDLPGHGLSDHKPASGSYAIWDDLRFVLAVAEQMAWPKFVLIGHSRGAIMASLLAGAMPERISHLICLDGFLPPPEDPANFPVQLGRYVRDFAQLGGGDKGYIALSDAVAARRVATPMSELAARLIVERGSYGGEDGRVYWRSDRRLKLASPVKLGLAQLQANMDAIVAPSMLVVADQGFGRVLNTLPPTLLSGFEIQHIEGGHHCHMDEQARQISQWVRAFVGLGLTKG